MYVIKMELPDGTVVYKIGMCNSNRSTDRMMEILRSWFVNFRFIPYSELKLDMETGRPMETEAHIHKCLEHKKYLPGKKVDGGTEMFTGIDEFRVLQYLRHCNDKVFDEPLELTDEDYKHLGQLISP